MNPTHLVLARGRHLEKHSLTILPEDLLMLMHMDVTGEKGTTRTRTTGMPGTAARGRDLCETMIEIEYWTEMLGQTMDGKPVKSVSVGYRRRSLLRLSIRLLRRDRSSSVR